MNYTIQRREVCYALSEALDYVGIDDTLHGKRVAYMAAEIGRKALFTHEETDKIIIMGMLHDCGVSSTDVHSYLVSELDWDNSQVHCIRGAKLLEQTGIYHEYAPVIYYHHTHWNNFPDTVDEKTKLYANIIYLADRIDALCSQVGNLSKHNQKTIITTILEYKGEMFAPELVDAFVHLSESDAFWFYLDPDSLHGYFREWIDQQPMVEVSYDFIKKIALMFSEIVDAKSNFTSEHSHCVASLARYLSILHGLNQSSQEVIEIAALLHDLGKLRVADAILHKPAPLDEDERSLMNRHGFDSHAILRQIKGFEKIALIASLHHETLDGKGYPYQIEGDAIPIEARILAVADIFQALVQDRPYRKGLSAHETLDILNKMASEGKIDTSIVLDVANNLSECYRYALTK